MRCFNCNEKFTPKTFLQKSCANLDCQSKLRELQKSKSKVKKAYTIPKQSPQRKLEEIIYKSEKLKFFMIPKNKICPINGSEAVEVHHKWSGKDRNKYFLDTSTWLGVSRLGHIWIHNNPKEARKLGYLF